ncbi:TPA: hypothetical protein SIE67_004092 [Escherichia coli]|nr:hypothetical protein [Escherichia coli]
MSNWEYLKGCEKDFDGHKTASVVVKSGLTGIIYYLGHYYVGKVSTIEGAGDIVIAIRIPVNDEQDLNDCIGAPESDATEQLITERGSRYGKFKDGAAIMQELKFVMREVDGWHNLTPSQREALDMIQHKIGRILNGDPTYDDSWKDIAGYATLIVNELNGEIK